MKTNRSSCIIRRGILEVTGTILAVAASGGAAHAAPLFYANNTGIYLSTPGITFTIASGSSADGLVVNATSVAVTLSGTTGGSFSLTSSAADLSVATSSSGGTVAMSCTSGVASTTISQNIGSTVYTITPTGSPCIVTSATTPSVTVATGGGGSTYDLSVNGGATETATTSVTLSFYGTGAYTMEVSNTSTFAGASWIPYTTATPWTLASGLGSKNIYAQFRSVGGTVVGTARASIVLVTAASSPSASSSLPSPSSVSSSQPSAASLLAELKILQAKLASLLAEANGAATVSPTSVRFVFTRNLYFGITGNDVTELQSFLISHNTGPAARKLSVHGMTKNFGILTQNALMEFQKKAGIKPASGYFGPITRKYVNSIIPF